MLYHHNLYILSDNRRKTPCRLISVDIQWLHVIEYDFCFVSFFIFSRLMDLLVFSLDSLVCLNLLMSCLQVNFNEFDLVLFKL